MRSGRLWIAALVALASAAGSYLAFAEGPSLVDRLLHPPVPGTHRKFVPPPPPAPEPYVMPVEVPASTAVVPLRPVTIPGVTLPPPRKSQ